VVIGTDIQPPGNAVFTVNDSIQKISQEVLSLAIKKINASGKDKRIWVSVKKKNDMYFNLTNDDIVFSLLDSACGFNYSIGAVNKNDCQGLV
jgi:hypothetical protein